jgi:tetratricopeptide (TPR) repeat protein
MAWSWIKVGQSAVAMQVLDQLTANFPQSPYIPESYLLKGYANMLLKRYSPAKEMLERCVELCKGDFITDEDLGQRKQQFQGVVTAFKPTGDNIRKNAMRRPTDRSVLERDALRVEFDKFSRENDDFFKYVLLGQSHKKFLRQKEQIQLDAEYALAKVVSMMGTQKQDQQLQKDQQKIQNIDQEIEKIKKDMEQGK